MPDRLHGWLTFGYVVAACGLAVPVHRLVRRRGAGPCFIRTGRPAAGPDDDRRRCRSARIQHLYPDETAPGRIAAWTPPRLGRPHETRPRVRTPTPAGRIR